MEMIKREMLSHQAVIAKTIESLQSHIYTASIITIEALKNGQKIDRNQVITIAKKGQGLEFVNK